MRIVVDSRYAIKHDGKQWLQHKYLEPAGIDASGALSITGATVSDWEDVRKEYEEYEDMEND